MTLNFVYSSPYSLYFPSKILSARSWASCSSTLEVGDDVSAILGVSDTSESHGVTRSEGWRTLEPLVEVTVSPLDSGLGRERSGVGEALARGDVLSWETTEGRSNGMRLYTLKRDKRNSLIGVVYLPRAHGIHRTNSWTLSRQLLRCLRPSSSWGAF